MKRSDVGTGGTRRLAYNQSGAEDIPINSMPGVSRLGWQTGLLREVAEARAAGVNSVVIFPKTPDHLKTSTAEEAFNEDGLAQRTFRLLKSKCVLDSVSLFTLHTHTHITHSHTHTHTHMHMKATHLFGAC